MKEASMNMDTGLSSFVIQVEFLSSRQTLLFLQFLLVLQDHIVTFPRPKLRMGVATSFIMLKPIKKIGRIKS